MPSPDNEKVVRQIDELFQLLEIREKGIAKLYDYILREGIIEDLNAVVSTVGLTLKRGYKVASVLKDHELVLVYDRPMKVSLQDPIHAWEKLVNEKIEEIREQANLRIDKLEQGFISFKNVLRKEFNFSPVTKAPVEFIKYDTTEFLFYPFYAEEELLIARGNYYEKPELTQFFEKIEEGILRPAELLEVSKAMKNVHVKLLLSEDLLHRLENAVNLAKDKFSALKDREKWPLQFKSLEVRVTSSPFANFIIIDGGTLMQPSFDPAMAENGAFLSGEAETLSVFKDKFESIFLDAQVLELYAKENSFSVEKEDWPLLCLL